MPASKDVLGFSLVMRARDIRALRRSHGWTQADLAAMLGTDAVTVSRWERGASRPRPSAVARLRELAAPVPPSLSGLTRVIGAENAERILRRAALLGRRARRHRFVDDPTRRLRAVERARREQLALRGSVRLEA